MLVKHTIYTNNNIGIMLDTIEVLMYFGYVMDVLLPCVVMCCWSSNTLCKDTKHFSLQNISKQRYKILLDNKGIIRSVTDYSWLGIDYMHTNKRNKVNTNISSCCTINNIRNSGDFTFCFERTLLECSIGSLILILLVL